MLDVIKGEGAVPSPDHLSEVAAWVKDRVNAGGDHETKVGILRKEIGDPRAFFGVNMANLRAANKEDDSFGHTLKRLSYVRHIMGRYENNEELDTLKQEEVLGYYTAVKESIGEDPVVMGEFDQQIVEVI